MAAKPSTTKRMIIMLGATTLVFGAIFGFKAVGNYFMNDFFDNMPPPTATITAATVSEQEWQESLRTVGNVAAVNRTLLSVQVPGVITEINFANGAVVAPGDVLVRLDSSVDEAERARLVAQLEIAEIEAQRLQRLGVSENVSASELARAESEVAQLTAALATQDALIAQKTIRAPFAGRLGIRQVNLGEYVAPGTGLVHLLQEDPVFINFTLAERYLSRLQLGQPVRAEVAAFPEVTFTGEITAISPQLNEATRTIQVQATFANQENSNAHLQSGMFARVAMDISAPQTVMVIPRTAVQFNPFGNVVYVIHEEDGKLRARQQLIRTGQEQGDLIAVTEGLAVGDRVVSSGLLKLRNNAVVKINDDEDLQPAAERNPRPVNE